MRKHSVQVCISVGMHASASSQELGTLHDSLITTSAVVDSQRALSLYDYLVDNFRLYGKMALR